MTLKEIESKEQQKKIKISQKKLLPHNPEIFTINQLEVNYNKDVKMNTNVINFLDRITCNKYYRKEAILQIIGYSMTASTDMQKAFIFYGQSAANGKSMPL